MWNMHDIDAALGLGRELEPAELEAQLEILKRDLPLGEITTEEYEELREQLADRREPSLLLLPG